jgi:hypothetical protein
MQPVENSLRRAIDVYLSAGDNGALGPGNTANTTVCMGKAGSHGKTTRMGALLIERALALSDHKHPELKPLAPSYI